MHKIVAAFGSIKMGVACSFVLATLCYINVQGLYHLTPAMVQKAIIEAGGWAPAVLISLLTIRPLLLFPSIILTLAGGMLFGPLWGTIYVVIGSSLGAYLCFAVTRYFGRERFEATRWGRHAAHMVEEHSIDYGFRTVLFMRIVPLFHYDLVSYGSGLSQIRFFDYAAATTLGMIPGVAAYNVLGSSLTDMFSPRFYAAVLLVAAVLLAPLAYHRFRRL